MDTRNTASGSNNNSSSSNSVSRAYFEQQREVLVGDIAAVRETFVPPHHVYKSRANHNGDMEYLELRTSSLQHKQIEPVARSSHCCTFPPSNSIRINAPKETAEKD